MGIWVQCKSLEQSLRDPPNPAISPNWNKKDYTDLFFSVLLPQHELLPQQYYYTSVWHRWWQLRMFKNLLSAERQARNHDCKQKPNKSAVGTDRWPSGVQAVVDIYNREGWGIILVLLSMVNMVGRTHGKQHKYTMACIYNYGKISW